MKVSPILAAAACIAAGGAYAQAQQPTAAQKGGLMSPGTNAVKIVPAEQRLAKLTPVERAEFERHAKTLGLDAKRLAAKDQQAARREMEAAKGKAGSAQDAMQRQQQAMQRISEMMKKMHETQSDIIRNIK